MLNDNERIRYTRQLLLDKWGEETQEKLKNTTIFVGGAGGSGSPIITQLALLGIGHIKICDFDEVDLSNLNRQFIHCVSEDSRIDVNKAVSAKKTVHNINPNVKVTIFTEKITDENVDEMVGDADVIMDCVDKIQAKFILSKAALRKEIPHLFYGMMDINSFVCVFNPPETPCFHCLYDYDKVMQMKELSEKSENASTPVCCSPVFLSAGFAVTELLKVLYDIGEPAYNKYYLFLQKGNERVIKSDGYMGMRFWITRYFEKISMDQGYDWDKGWRGNFIEELDIAPNPDCSYCSNLGQEDVEEEEEEVKVSFKFKKL